MKKLIALIGPAGCGKTTIAKYLEREKNYVHLKFADGLKNMLRSIGLTEDELEGDLKEVPSETLLGETPRHAMQTLGTEWGRNCINRNIWSNIFRLRTLKVFEQNYNVVVDDLRFLNEAEVVKSLNGTIIRILRPSLDLENEIYLHQSERENELIKEDYNLVNVGTIKDFLIITDSIMKGEEVK